MNVLEIAAIVHELNEMLNVQTAMFEDVLNRLKALEESDKVNRSEVVDQVEGNRLLKEASDAIPF